MLLVTEIGAIVLAIILQHVNAAAFIVTPSPIVVGQEAQAQFDCSYSNTNLIEWMVNNSTLGNKSHPGISQKSFTTDGGIYLSTLTIMAFQKYNETEVVCEALIRTGDVIQSIKAPPVQLLIQGPLNMVLELQRNSSTITWVPPFSLDLTGVDPDIVYCVEVYNITCGVDDLVVGDCNVTEAHYVDNRLQQGYIYRITVTPRSNGHTVQNGQHGTNNTKEEMFTLLIDPKSTVALASGSAMVSVTIQLLNDATIVGGIKPASYSLLLTSIDGIEEPPSNNIFATSFTCDINSVTLNVKQPLPRRRLWNYQVLPLSCGQHPITNSLELSTHDFQNFTLSSSSRREIGVSGDFIDGSTATGILITVYSPNNDSNIHYQFIPRSDIRYMTTMNNFPGGEYQVSVFVMEENGLPYNWIATTPRNVSVKEGENSDNNFQIKYEVHPNSTHVCIICTFLDSSITDCVAVVHQRISQLSSSGLMNIESSHKFNRSGDTAFGCIPGVNLEQYQVGVVGGRPIKTQPEQDSQVEIIVGVTVGISVAGVGLIIISVAIVIIWKKKKNTSCTIGPIQKKV